ncbi:hypothetical protein H8S37_00975 [Mediterraneibacter sp. NSJ-55]|uniref:Uncharacterized protein n=1 Tax=Mediterraneibacter hominis TaxID=2763054 RepID=A0A923LG26_9FIRM|nr:hypothetical protein [Mediterraneibacter hominis]MBC5687507.1 hypothetical protein [Mediterraneibacter hominis]
MLDKSRIRLMTRAAIYEKNRAEEDLKISSYYKKDYASLHTWITLVWVTIGYICAAGLVVFCYSDSLLEDLNFAKLFVIAAVAIGAYLVLIVIYGVCASGFYKKKHNQAKQRVKKYYRDLSRLGKMYMKEKK